MENQPRILQETALLTGRALRLGKLAFERVFTAGARADNVQQQDGLRQQMASLQIYSGPSALLAEQDLPELRKAHQ